MLKTSVTLSSLFPEITDPALVAQLERPQGAVIAYRPECSDFGESTRAGRRTLVWTRLVREKCGDEDTFLMVFSPVPERMSKAYLRILASIQAVGIAMPEHRNMIYVRSEIENAVLAKFRRPRPVRANSRPKHAQSHGVGELSDSSSVHSILSLEGGGRSLSQLDMFAQELQISVSSKKTPTLIKRLFLVLLGFLGVVVTLLMVESNQFLSEAEDLKERFKMIEYYQIRYELIIYMAMSPQSYNFYLGGGVESTFEKYCARALARADRVTTYNVLTRMSFSKFQLNYDYEDVTISYGGDIYIASFYYAFIKVCTAHPSENSM